MAKQVLFVQGGGAAVHDEWDNKLVESLERLLGPDYEIRYPRMPDEGDPRYSRWKSKILAEIGKLEEGSAIVGHSIGATILAHSLAEEAPKRAPAGIFFISMPFIGDNGWPSDEIEPKEDLGARLPAPSAIYIYQGSADDIVPAKHADLNAKAIPQAVVRRLPNRDHQLNNDMFEIAADIRELGGVGT